MTVQELYERIMTLSDEERKEWIPPLLKMLTPVSNNELIIFQNIWNTKKSWEEFKEAQANCIRMSLQMEISEIGELARKHYGLEPLTWETEITQDQYYLHSLPESNS